MFFVGDFCDVGITRSLPCVLYFTEIKMENTNCQNGQKAQAEDIVIRQIEIEILQDAMLSLTKVQKERLHPYFLRK